MKCNISLFIHCANYTTELSQQKLIIYAALTKEIKKKRDKQHYKVQ